MLRKSIFFAAIVLIVAPFSVAAAIAQESSSQKAHSNKVVKNGIRVGTFDSRLVAVAYVRSSAFEKRMSGFKAEMEAAKKAKDDDRIKQIEANVVELQHHVHKQGFSTWPVGDIFKLSKMDLSKIAQQAKVDLIVSKWDVIFQNSGAETVDVTELLVAPFEPNEATKKVLKELARKKPLPLDQIKKH